jgi:hypothetical protein
MLPNLFQISYHCAHNFGRNAKLSEMFLSFSQGAADIRSDTTFVTHYERAVVRRTVSDLADLFQLNKGRVYCSFNILIWGAYLPDLANCRDELICMETSYKRSGDPAAKTSADGQIGE